MKKNCVGQLSLKKWKTEGEFTIYNGLIDDEPKFYKYIPYVSILF